MHPRRALAAAAAAVIVPLLTAAVPPPRHAAAPPADRAPVCGAPAATGFPIDSRLYGGPTGYSTGVLADGFALELRNTTADVCRDVHPLIILVDRDGRLTPRHFTLRYAPSGEPWRTVPFETTDRGENIGIPDGEDAPGLTVPAGAAVTVRLRLWFAPGAPAGPVVASATTMQRRGEDGSWVGESNHYAFEVVPPPPVLADTGAGGRARAALAATGAAAGLLVAAGAAMVAGARRHAPRRRSTP